MNASDLTQLVISRERFSLDVVELHFVTHEVERRLGSEQVTNFHAYSNVRCTFYTSK